MSIYFNKIFGCHKIPTIFPVDRCLIRTLNILC